MKNTEYSHLLTISYFDPNRAHKENFAKNLFTKTDRVWFGDN